MALHQSQEPTPCLNGLGHLSAGIRQGAGEVVPPIVLGPVALYLYAVGAGLAVTDELLYRGPKVLGPKVVRHG